MKNLKQRTGWMTKVGKSFLLVMMLIPLGCSTLDGGARKTGSSGPFQLRPFDEQVLPNGLKLIIVRDNSLPRVSIQMMVRAGGLNESKEKAGLAPLVFALVDQGTAKNTALDIADQLAQMGAEFGATAGADMSFVSGSAISPSRQGLLDLFHEIVTTPAFSKNELERVKSQHLAAIQKAKDQPQSYTDQLFDEELFGEHPYGRHHLGTLESVKRIQRQDLLDFYKTWIQPKNCVLSVVGQIDEAFIEQVKAKMGSWQSTAAPGVLATRAKAPEGALRRLVSKKGLKQTQIRIGQLGIPRNDPDFLRLRMAAMILGGAFASRLNQHIRDDLGLTYSISASSEARLDPGSFEISTFSRDEVAAETIRETLKMFEEFAAKGVTNQEMAAAKAVMVGQFPAALETPDRLVYNLMVLRRYGISDDYLKNYISTVNAMTLQEVNEAIRRRLHPEALRILVYADGDKVGPSLKTIGEWQVQSVQ